MIDGILSGTNGRHGAEVDTDWLSEDVFFRKAFSVEVCLASSHLICVRGVSHLLDLRTLSSWIIIHDGLPFELSAFEKSLHVWVSFELACFLVFEMEERHSDCWTMHVFPDILEYLVEDWVTLFNGNGGEVVEDNFELRSTIAGLEGVGLLVEDSKGVYWGGGWFFASVYHGDNMEI